MHLQLTLGTTRFQNHLRNVNTHSQQTINKACTVSNNNAQSCPYLFLTVICTLITLEDILPSISNNFQSMHIVQSCVLCGAAHASYLQISQMLEGHLAALFPEVTHGISRR